MNRLGAKLGGLIMGLCTISAAIAEDRPPGSGVLCAYTIYSGALLDAKLCGWEMTPQGQAVERAVSGLEAYMRANSAEPERVEEYRANFAAGIAMMRAEGEDAVKLYCERRDPDRPNYFGRLRFQNPSELDVTELLSRPGEPTYGDCF